MHDQRSIHRRIRFGAFELDVRSGELHKGATRLRVPDKSIEILRALLEQPGELVTRETRRDRPVTAIRWPDDGNPATESDASWRPFLVTPPYPDYPCALPTSAGAGAEVLRQFFGSDDIAFTRTFAASPVALPAPMTALPGKTITRTFHSLSEAVEEAQSARVYDGLHFREGCGVRRPPGHADRAVHRQARTAARQAEQGLIRLAVRWRLRQASVSDGGADS